MLLHCLNGHFFPVEYPSRQCGLHISLFKDLREVFYTIGSAGGNHRDGNSFSDMLDQLNIKTAVSTVLINAVEELSMVSPELLVCYGVSASGPDNDTTFGPLVLYRPDDNTLAWINESLSQSDRKQMEFLSSVAAGESSVPVTGDVVFEKLQANVLEQPGRVLSV